MGLRDDEGNQTKLQTKVKVPDLKSGNNDSAFRACRSAFPIHACPDYHENRREEVITKCKTKVRVSEFDSRNNDSTFRACDPMIIREEHSRQTQR